MQFGDIVPSIIKDAPLHKLFVTYPTGELNFGNELRPEEVKDQPQVKWDADSQKYYTLLMTDLDAPNRTEHTYRHVNHWLVVNIPGNNLEAGDVITEYVGSGPPKGSGFHRYLFLVFEQKPGKINFTEPRTPKNSRDHRLKFSITDFQDKYNLGRAYAGNYYEAQWEPYVEEFRKRRELKELRNE